MKDYYEILGVKQDASQEEIRARWTELTGKYLADPPQEPEIGQELKELSEAYEILNNEASRFDYDLDRAFSNPLAKGLEQAPPPQPKAMVSQPEVIVLPPAAMIPHELEIASPKVKRFHFCRIPRPVGLLILVLMVGLFIFQRHHVKRSTMTTSPQDKSEALFQPPLPSIPSAGKKLEPKKHSRPKIDLKSEGSSKVEKRIFDKEESVVSGKPEKTTSEIGLPVRKDVLPARPDDTKKVQAEPMQGSAVTKPAPEGVRQPPDEKRPGSHDTKNSFERVYLFGH